MIKTGIISQDVISETVSSYFSISTFDMFKKCRKKRNVNARYVFLYLSRKFTKDSFQDIADYVTKKGFRTEDYDHATVLHACSKMSGYIDSYIETKELIRTLTFIIQQNKTNSIVVSDVDLLITVKNKTNIN
jgi:chromosomal replication initiation ATPase DnaA